MSNWPTFFYDTNGYGGVLIESRSHWRELLRQEAASGVTLDTVLTRTSIRDPGRPLPQPNFGNRREHLGGRCTLGAYLSAWGVDPREGA